VRAMEKGLELAYHVSADVPDTLVGDPGRLRQIVLNLAGNAVKFTEQGEVVVTVSVSASASADKETRRQGDKETEESKQTGGKERSGDASFSLSPGPLVSLSFEVRDTGIGISREKQQEIFEAFTQADPSTTRKYGGTGLGLTISSQLVQMMGGRIWVESEVGRGSTFHFVLPFGLQESTVGELPLKDLTSLTDLPVLVVDDNVTNRRILEATLKNWH